MRTVSEACSRANSRTLRQARTQRREGKVARRVLWVCRCSGLKVRTSVVPKQDGESESPRNLLVHMQACAHGLVPLGVSLPELSAGSVFATPRVFMTSRVFAGAVFARVFAGAVCGKCLRLLMRLRDATCLRLPTCLREAGGLRRACLREVSSRRHVSSFSRRRLPHLFAMSWL